MPVEIPISGYRVDHVALREWVGAVAVAVGTPQEIARDVAEVLVAADLRGVASHGTFRLPVYASLAKAGVLDVTARPERVGGTDVFSAWTGHHGWGHHLGRVLIEDAVARARRYGLAASIARQASHFGIAGWYAMRAADEGMIGLVMTNTSPLTAPTRGRARLLGTNPIAIAAPSRSHGHVVLDMATSAITWGRVLVAARRSSLLTHGVALDRNGRVSVDPSSVLANGSLMPLGGGEETAGYKGYGLALMVDVLTGVLAGANFGSRVVPFSTTLGPSDLGQLFVAIDPATVGDGDFAARMDALVGELHSCPVAQGAQGGVLVPGQPEAEYEKLQRRTGIALDSSDCEALVKLGAQLGVPFPERQAFTSCSNHE